MNALKTMVKFVIRAFFLITVTLAFFGVPYFWIPVSAQRLLCGAALTLVLGRFFCDTVCPLGIIQTLVNWLCHPKRHVRRVCTRLPETRAQWIVRWSVVGVCVALAAGGCLGAAMLLTPMSVLGKAITLWAPGVALFAAVVLLAAIGDGRIWCNWICPYGTVFNLLSKLSIFRSRVGKGCGNCRKCFEKREAVGKSAAENKDGGVTRRETLRGVALLAAAEKLTDGGFAEVSLPGTPERGASVLPPGAVDRRQFAAKCVGCQLCVANCPGGCLKPSVKLATFGQPEMDFRHGYCMLGCAKCAEVCPEQALENIQREQKPNVHLGHAVWKRDLCVRTTIGEQCTACVRKCPVQAIHLVKGFPVVDRFKCIGCGACEHVCPARPLPAIFVRGFERQRVVNPISEVDMIAEMKACLDAGAAVVVTRGGVIIATEKGRGIAPLLKLLDEQKLSGSVVMDKVVGRAAAAICAAGGAVKVFTELAGEGAAELLAAHGIELSAKQTVATILNREKSDSCPMEKAVKELANPEEMVNAIRKAMKK